ncbi:MAG: serine/threonine protein kinase [Spirochaetales bacterium]
MSQEPVDSRDDSRQIGGAFDALSPALILESVEAAYAIVPDGSLSPYSSYVNRVYGLRSDEGAEYVVKFYRPGRWTEEAILEEHQFLADCAAAELPVVAPLSDQEGATLPAIEIETDEEDSRAGRNGSAAPLAFFFALFPKHGGRSFDAESESDWLRLGSLAGRLHGVGAKRPALARPHLGPQLAFANLSIVEPLVHPEFRAEFSETCREILDRTAESVKAIPSKRIHGDLHRGNILERPGEGLILLDFDDMMMGPPVQDLWLLLPGRASECSKELSLLVEGYSEFSELEAGSVDLIETLRFYRMLHFLAWRSLQRDDQWFRRDFPDWGHRSFWIRELEDFREQARIIAADASA